MSKHMALSVFLHPAGYHQDAWRHPDSRSADIGELQFVIDFARQVEAAKLDSVFFAGAVAVGSLQDPLMAGFYEPIATMSALASVTSKIGLVGTISTSFSDPFNVARSLAGADLLTGGRVGWNMVTSWLGGENFGVKEMPSAEDRYRRATEFVEVTNKLWASWSDSAVANDKARGVWLDPEKVQAIHHKGEFFDVEGPLNMRRSPQGRPVLFQAGQSPAGVEFGSSYADVIYTAQPVQSLSIQFMNEFKAKARAKGRKTEQIKILPGLLPILGKTQKEAEEYAAELANCIDLDHARRRLVSQWPAEMNVDDIGLDEAIPVERWIDDPSKGSRYEIQRRRSVEDGFTLRELIIDATRSRNHLLQIGTPSSIADKMIEWFESGACDGFSLNPPSLPEGLDRICNLLVPELQDRGYFRTEYEGDTLRDHLGLDRPGAWDAA